MARKSPEVNAGSMADIAFLLLIFFLVTTTIETDSGINRKLPPMEELIDPPIIKERNIFTVVVNKNNDILVEEKPMELRDVREAAVAFLDNGGGVGEEACDYCKGERDSSSSDNPDKAIISLKNDRETDYKVYISVQNELVAAYNQLRDREFMVLFPEERMTYVEADKLYTDPRTSLKVKTKLKPKLDVLKKMYPQKLSEAEPSKTN
jgi:biopolymer transport protein ExbD